VAHPLATRHASSGASGVPRRVRVERRRQKQIRKPARGRLLEIRTLSRWGARYTERRRGERSLILRDWVSDSSRGLGLAFCERLRPKSPMWSGFLGCGTTGKLHAEARLSWVYDLVGQKEAAMRTPMRWRTERGRYFPAHPQQAMFSLIASMLLAGLVVLALALSAR
jgi:hypothetical protein